MAITIKKSLAPRKIQFEWQICPLVREKCLTRCRLQDLHLHPCSVFLMRPHWSERFLPTLQFCHLIETGVLGKLERKNKVI